MSECILSLSLRRKTRLCFLASPQKVNTSVSAAICTDLQSVLDILERCRGKDFPPSLENTRYPDLIGPILLLLYERMQLGSQTIIYIVWLHRGLALNEVAYQQADIGKLDG